MIRALDGSCYAVTYGQAFTIEEGLVEWKKRIVARRSDMDPQQKRTLDQLMKSVPSYGVTVENFLKMNRRTAMDFYDFVAYNVRRLLISYRDPLMA